MQCNLATMVPQGNNGASTFNVWAVVCPITHDQGNDYSGSGGGGSSTNA